MTGAFSRAVRKAASRFAIAVKCTRREPSFRPVPLWSLTIDGVSGASQDSGVKKRQLQIITLTTDFGTRDHYVGAIKGVILSIAPSIRIVDITHDVEPHQVLQGAFVLRQIWPWYPPGTIHLAVVDPGVGSDRRIILGQYGGQYVIAPDNGLVTFVHRDFPVEAMYAVQNRRYFLPDVAATFHGRDIMAPVAAHLGGGVRPAEFGPATDLVELLPVAHRAVAGQAGLDGRALYADRFGNLVTNISAEQLIEHRVLCDRPVVVVNGEQIGPIRLTFSDVAPGEPVALIGSSGMLEISLNRGNAARRYDPLDKVRVEVR